MSSLESILRSALEALQRFQNYLSSHWREHSNRRSLIALAIITVLVGYTYIALIEAPADFPVGQLVTVEDGVSAAVLADQLASDGVIRSPLVFKALLMVLGADRNVRAGDYLFKEPENVLGIARAMSLGAFGLEPTRIRIPEGANTKEMAAIFDQYLLRFDADSFMVQAQRFEGYLFPDTYFFLPNVTEDTVIQTMRQNFDIQLASIQESIDASGKPLNDLVILASIIEKEARDSEDRRKISSVLWNRLNDDMALQVDVTFLYTIGKGTFDLTKDDLASDSPYNTYVNKGLPPTPIGSPSLDALLAAAEPADTDFYFFMADLQGVTHFCRTHACHQANKLRYY